LATEAVAAAVLVLPGPPGREAVYSTLEEPGSALDNQELKYKETGLAFVAKKDTFAEWSAITPDNPHLTTGIFFQPDQEATGLFVHWETPSTAAAPGSFLT